MNLKTNPDMACVVVGTITGKLQFPMSKTLEHFKRVFTDNLMVGGI